MCGYSVLATSDFFCDSVWRAEWEESKTVTIDVNWPLISTIL